MCEGAILSCQSINTQVPLSSKPLLLRLPPITVENIDLIEVVIKIEGAHFNNLMQVWETAKSNHEIQK
jgi:hypothetical protein